MIIFKKFFSLLSFGSLAYQYTNNSFSSIDDCM
uniref:Uncharacterized protein n=1 Tax=Rhizophora mucronata TaxID=61149 RepID=A0A2P2PCW9_RHIMU